MISRFALGAALAAAPLTAGAAQSMAGMPGMAMPMPAKKALVKKVPVKRAVPKTLAKRQPLRLSRTTPPPSSPA